MGKLRAFAVRRGGLLVAIAIILFGAGKAVGWPQRVTPEGGMIIAHLNVAITWYRQMAGANPSAGQVSDSFFFENARDLARQALRLAFQSADAEAELIAASPPGPNAGNAKPPAAGSKPALPLSSTPATEQQKNLATAAANAAAHLSQVQAQLQQLEKEIPRAPGKKREQLLAQRDSLQAEVGLDTAVQEAIQKLVSFGESSGVHAAGLQAEIDELKKSVPDLSSTAPLKAPASAAAPAGSQPAATQGGLITQGALLFNRLRDLSELSDLIDGTTRVSGLARQLQTPLRAKLKAALQQGRDLASQPTPQDPAQAASVQQNIVSLTTEFKQISSAALPLSQEIMLLDECRGNLVEWRTSVRKACMRLLQVVLTRLLAILIGIGVVVVVSRFWRRATLRYVREPRRRHQLLLLQRFVTGFGMAVVILIGFVSEFGSLATFAGFLTAGIAVALQTVILSVAAYFFLVGRYGVRVGDRITVSGVTGDVVDVGIVRLYLMELAGTGVDLHPTGRLVVVSNSVLFQGTPFFKQIPGTAYTWHELVVTLAPGGDHKLAETKLLEAVNQVYSSYRQNIEQQYASSESMMQSQFSSPTPEAHLQMMENGLDLVIRYPVEIHREAEIDSQMARKLIEAISTIPELKSAAGSPRIRSAIKG